jgi:hypothetical protein
MRASLTLSLTVLVLHLAGSGVSAQPTIAPPRAPDMLNPGYYYRTQTGMVYGPNYNVRPCYPPFQGAVLGPTTPVPYQMGNIPPGGCGPGGWPYGPSGPPAGNPNGGTAAFPSHLFSRSPRDFFMIETDPRASPYNYGPYGSSGRTGVDYP